MSQPESKPKQVIIKSFDPLEVSFPRGPLTGSIQLVLPALHIKVLDLSMGGLIPGGPHFGADVEGACLNLQTDEGYEWGRGELVEFITQAQGELESIWQIYQDEFNKRFLLGRNQ